MDAGTTANHHLDPVQPFGLNFSHLLNDFTTSMELDIDFGFNSADEFEESINQFVLDPLRLNSDDTVSDDDDDDDDSNDSFGDLFGSEEQLFSFDEEGDTGEGRSRRQRLPNAYQYEFFDVTQACWYQKFLITDDGIRDRTYFLSERDRYGTFRSHFRMPLKKVDDLVNLFLSKGWIKYTHHCRSPALLQIKAELLILSSLNILAHGTPFRALESSTNISYTEIRKFFHFFIEKMCSLEDEFIYLPRDEEELEQAMKPYENVGIPGCIGSIDVVHIKWSNCPAGDFNRSKGKESFPSVAFEVVTDHERRIRGVSSGQFGTRNDRHIVKTDNNVRVLREGWYSDVVWQYFDKHGITKSDIGVFYISDNGFCRWRVTICPYKHQTSSTPEGEWSENLETVRKDVECCFGILKKRWRILDHGLKFRNMRICEKIFTTCCILHNIMLDEVEAQPPRVNRGNAPHPGDGLWIEGPSDMIEEGLYERSESTLWGRRRRILVDHFSFWKRNRRV